MGAMAYIAHSFVRFAVAAAAAFVLILGWSVSAGAHTELRASTPEEGSTVDSLSEVRLEFTSALLDIGTELTLVDATGEEHSLVPEFPSDNAVTGNAEGLLAPGEAELRWRVVAEDGHPIEGVLSFTYAGDDASPAPESSPAETPEPERAVDSVETPEPTASAEPAEPAEDDMPRWVWAVLAIVALGTAVAAVFARRTWRQ